MKKNNSMISILIVVFVILAWYVGLGDMRTSSSDYNQHIRSAETYESENLYQKAINSYQSALTYEDSLEIRIRIIDLYIKGFEIGEITTTGNLEAMILDTLSVYREEPVAYDTACDYFLQVLDYDELANVFDMAAKYEITTDKLTETKEAVRYLYKLSYSTYSEPTNITYGYYVVQSDGTDYSLTQTMTTSLRGYDVLSAYSSAGYVVGSSAGKVFIMDSNGLRHQYMSDDILSSSGLANGNIACEHEDSYVYYGTDGEIKSDSYSYAGRFSSGIAAVQTSPGEWRLINTNYEFLTDEMYEDVKLNSAEECVSGGIVFVRQNGRYKMLNVAGYDASDLTKVRVEATAFECDDCDLPADPTVNSNSGPVWFAYRDGETWGYADVSGEVKVAPQFDGAKSFSNGYAAVLDGEFWSFIDDSGAIVITGEFTNAGYFNPSGYCMVQRDNGYWTYFRMYFW